MPTLMTMLHHYPKDWVLNRYIQCSRESWSKGKFFLGGQIQLGIDDEITWNHIAEAQAKYCGPIDVTNSFEDASIKRHSSEFSHFRDIYTDHIRINTCNGLLRAIVFFGYHLLVNAQQKRYFILIDCTKKATSKKFN